MRRYLLDSNAVSAFIDHRGTAVERVREARLRGDRVGTCEPVVAEERFGDQSAPLPAPPGIQ